MSNPTGPENPEGSDESRESTGPDAPLPPDEPSVSQEPPAEPVIPPAPPVEPGVPPAPPAEPVIPPAEPVVPPAPPVEPEAPPVVPPVVPPPSPPAEQVVPPAPPVVPPAPAPEPDAPQAQSYAAPPPPASAYPPPDQGGFTGGAAVPPPPAQPGSELPPQAQPAAVPPPPAQPGFSPPPAQAGGFPPPPPGQGGFPPPPGQGGGFPPPPQGGFPPPPQGGFPPPGGAYASQVQATDGFSWGWKKFTENWGTLVLAQLLWGLIIAALVILWSFIIIGIGRAAAGSGSATEDAFSVLGFFGTVVLFFAVIAGAFLSQIGMVHGYLEIANGKPVTLKDFFTFKNVGAALGATLLIALASMVGSFIIVGGLIVLFFALYVIWFIVDQRRGAIDGIKAGINLSANNFGQTALLLLLVLVANAVGSALCGIGTLISAPLGNLATTYMYRRLQNQPVAP